MSFATAARDARLNNTIEIVVDLVDPDPPVLCGEGAERRRHL